MGQDLSQWFYLTKNLKEVGWKSLRRLERQCFPYVRNWQPSWKSCLGQIVLGFLADHRGMFSRLGASPEQVNELRENHAVYMVGDSRLNIAGLNSKTVPVLAKAIVDCGI